MQYDPRRVICNIQDIFYDHRYPLINQPPYETGHLYQPYSDLPSYAQCSQQSASNTDYVIPSAQFYGQTPSHQAQDVLYRPTNRSHMQTEVSTIIIPKFQVFFWISGILYFLLGGVAIGLEIAIIMYSHSVHYRGIWIGATMLGLGINTFIIAYRLSHSMLYMVTFLAFAFIFTLCGIVSTALDLGFTKQCFGRSSEYLCKKQLAVPFKVALLIELSICAIHIAINLTVANRIRIKSALKPPDPSTRNAAS